MVIYYSNSNFVGDALTSANDFNFSYDIVIVIFSYFNLQFSKALSIV